MATYSDGTLLRASGPEVDKMEGGERRWIPDPSTFNCMGLDWGAIQVISDSEWNQIPQGAAYPSRADGTLLQGSDSQMYVMTGCQRHLIPDPETFNTQNYDWNAIQRVSDGDLTAIPEGKPLPHKQQPAIAGKKAWLGPGEFLNVGDYLVSQNGQYLALMQNDGNFELRYCSYGKDPASSSDPYWTSNSAVQPESSYPAYDPFFVVMQTDGNFVIYKGTGPDNIYGGAAQGFHWNSGTTMGICFAVLQDDGNFVVYQGTDLAHQGAFCWNSGVADGTVTVENHGGYVARYTFTSLFFGRNPLTHSADNLEAGQSYSEYLAVGTSNIQIKFEAATGLAWDPWKTILDQTYPLPFTKTFTLTGTTLNPSYNES